MISIILIVTFIYLILIGSFVYGFDKVMLFHLEGEKSKTTFSIVIPFRNEADNLPHLLQTFKALHYQKQLFEVIFVDDDSEDSSFELISAFKTEYNHQPIKIIKNIRTSNSPKKDAITLAINHAKFDWIITTDADCKLPKYWLESFDEYIQKKDPNCIVAPITYNASKSFLKQFQLLDILSLQGATIGGFGINCPFLCNGANFAYKKEMFHKLNGFEGNDKIASGDDIFLLEKAIALNAKQVGYLKCEHAIVSTSPQPTWASLILQRVRWAGKTSAYNNWFGKLTGFTVLLMNALLICSILFLLFGAIKPALLLYIVVIKFSIDFLLIFKAASFLNQKLNFVTYILSFILYPFFCVYVAFISMFSGFKWKGREHKK